MREDIRSELCVPVLVGDETVGVLNVETTKARAYRPVDQKVLETASAHLAVVLAHGRLRGRIVTICASCKKVRDEQQRWRPVDEHFGDHAGYVSLSHGLCPDCMQALYPGFED